MREEIIGLLEDLLPLVNLRSDFLFGELSSLDITTIMMVLSEHYSISLTHEDVTPRNFRNIDSIIAMVQNKL